MTLEGEFLSVMYRKVVAADFKGRCTIIITVRFSWMFQTRLLSALNVCDAYIKIVLEVNLSVDHSWHTINFISQYDIAAYLSKSRRDLEKAKSHKFCSNRTVHSRYIVHAVHAVH